MSSNSGNGTVPSGFFAPTAASTRNQHAPQTSRHQQPMYNYGQPTAYCPYAAVQHPPSTAHAPSAPNAPTPVSRKRPRDGGTFRCEPCSLDLDSASALQGHQKSHVKCTACNFEGAPKVVKGHYQQQHGKFSVSGFKTVTVAIPGCPVQRFRICVGNRPEDVQKWIDERKKKFPRRRPVVVPQEAKPQQPKSEGLATLLEGYSSSEDEAANDEDAKAKATPAEEETKESPPGQNTKEQPSSPPKKPCHSFVRQGKCRRGDACPYSHDESLRKHKRKPNKKKDLLSTLLESDVEREAKLSLQLVHYLVNSEFLKKRV